MRVFNGFDFPKKPKQDRWIEILARTEAQHTIDDRNKELAFLADDKFWVAFFKALIRVSRRKKT